MVRAGRRRGGAVLGAALRRAAALRLREGRARVTREEAAAVGMTLALHAAEAPDRPAITGPTGRPHLRRAQRPGQPLVRALRRRGPAGRGARWPCLRQPARVRRGVLRRPPGRLPADHRQLAPHGRRGGVHRRRLRGRGPRGRRPLRRARRRSPAAPPRGAPGGGRTASTASTTTTRSSTPRTASDIDDPVLGSTHALHVGHHRPARRACTGPRPPPNAVAALGLYGYRAGRGPPPLHRAAVPRRPARLLARRAPAAGVGTVLMDGWDAEETLRLVEAHRITHTHMVPTMFHRLLVAARRGAGASTTCRRCASSSTAPRRARCRSSSG